MLDKFGEDRGLANIIIYSKILGGISMGILPATAYLIAFPETTFVDLGLGLNSKNIICHGSLDYWVRFGYVFIGIEQCKKTGNIRNLPTN